MSRKQVGLLQNMRITSTLRTASPRHVQLGDDQLNMFQTKSHTLIHTSLPKCVKQNANKITWQLLIKRIKAWDDTDLDNHENV